MSWIDERVQEILHTKAPWPGFAFKVVESPEGVFLLVSVEELSKFSQRQQDDLVFWLVGMLNRIRKLQVPCYIQEWKP